MARRALTLFVLLAAQAGLAACSQRVSAERYADTSPTKEAAAQAVLQALFERDTLRLHRLAISEHEFLGMVWPRLPASRPEVGMPAEYVWSDTSLKSRGELAATLEAYGGRRLTLEEIQFGGPTVDYGAFRIHPKARLAVRDDSGVRTVVRVFGSMIEASDEWKIFSYVVD